MLLLLLKGGPGVARIGVFTTASSDPIGAAAYYVDMFVNTYGAASATYIPVTENSNNADDQSVVELVRQQTGFFFGGGDQLRILTALRPNGRDTLVLAALKDMLKSGAVVGGTSAGTACQVFKKLNVAPFAIDFLGFSLQRELLNREKLRKISLYFRVLLL